MAWMKSKKGFEADVRKRHRELLNALAERVIAREESRHLESSPPIEKSHHNIEEKHMSGSSRMMKCPFCGGTGEVSEKEAEHHMSKADVAIPEALKKIDEAKRGGKLNQHEADAMISKLHRLEFKEKFGFGIG